MNGITQDILAEMIQDENGLDSFSDYWRSYENGMRGRGISKKEIAMIEEEIQRELESAYEVYESISTHGFYPENTGGNCQWYRKDHENGYTVIASEVSLPESMDSPCQMGEYDHEDKSLYTVTCDSVTEAIEKTKGR